MFGFAACADRVGSPSAACGLRSGTWRGENIQFNVDRAACVITERGSSLPNGAAVAVGPLTYGSASCGRQFFLYSYGDVRITDQTFRMSATGDFSVEGRFESPGSAAGTLRFRYQDPVCGLGTIEGTTAWRATNS